MMKGTALAIVYGRRAAMCGAYRSEATCGNTKFSVLLLALFTFPSSKSHEADDAEVVPFRAQGT